MTSELSNWMTWAPWQLRAFSTAQTTLDLSTTLGTDAWIVAVFTTDTNDDVSFLIGANLVYFQSTTLGTTFFQRPIPTVWAGPAPLLLTYARTGGSISICYIKKPT